MAEFIVASEINSTRSDLKNLFNFLSDFKNFKSILPEGKVQSFEFSENQCSFIMKGNMAISISLVEKKPYEFILFSSEGLGKFDFNLKVLFIGEPEKPGECKIELLGDLNPFIKGMV